MFPRRLETVDRYSEIRISRTGHCGRGELADGNVIWMTVGSFRTEGDYYLRPYPPEMFNNLPDGL